MTKELSIANKQDMQDIGSKRAWRQKAMVKNDIAKTESMKTRT
jgi:hypothetical protein